MMAITTSSSISVNAFHGGRKDLPRVFFIAGSSEESEREEPNQVVAHDEGRHVPEQRLDSRKSVTFYDTAHAVRGFPPRIAQSTTASQLAGYQPLRLDRPPRVRGDPP